MPFSLVQALITVNKKKPTLQKSIPWKRRCQKGRHVAMGQNPVPSVNIPIRAKIGSKMGGEFTYQPKWDPKWFWQPLPCHCAKWTPRPPRTKFRPKSKSRLAATGALASQPKRVPVAQAVFEPTTRGLPPKKPNGRQKLDFC